MKVLRLVHFSRQKRGSRAGGEYLNVRLRLREGEGEKDTVGVGCWRLFWTVGAGFRLLGLEP